MAIDNSWLGIEKSLRRLIQAVLMLIASIMVGMMGFHFLEDYQWRQAFFETVITISTVGYSLRKPLSPAGEIFIGFYIILNLAIFAYTISVITSYLFEGGLKKIFRSYIIDRVVKKLKNHVIVCGYGRNGYRACEELKNAGKDFVVIESDDDILNTIPDESSFHVIAGDATQDEILRLARVEYAKYIITTLPKDSDNVFITLTARELNPSIQIITRASDLNSERKMKVAGASKVVMPDLLGGYHMAQLITKPYVVEFLEMLNGTSDTSVTLEEIEYDELLPQFREKTVGELHIRAKTGATVIGYKCKDEAFTFNPGPDVTISKDSILIILGTVQTIENLRRVFLKHDEY